MNSKELQLYLNDLYKEKENQDLSQLEYILDLYKIDDIRKPWTYYSFNGIPVPRVSNILDATIGKQYLNNWAASLGTEYKLTRNRILNTGTLVHTYIEDYLLHGTRDSHPILEGKANIDEALNCYNNFTQWIHDMNHIGYTVKPLLIEKQTTTPYYAGTCDFVAQISRDTTMNYIIDFKSSGKISYEYYLQTMFYVIGFEFNRIVLGDLNFPEIDGIGILRLDKKKQKYEFATLDLYNFEHMNIINSLRQAVVSMVDWYYRQNSVKAQVEDFLKDHKNLDEVIKDVY